MNKLFILFAIIIISLLLPFLVDAEITTDFWVELVEGIGNWWKTTLIYQMWQNLFGNGFI